MCKGLEQRQNKAGWVTRGRSKELERWLERKLSEGGGVGFDESVEGEGRGGGLFGVVNGSVMCRQVSLL